MKLTAVDSLFPIFIKTVFIVCVEGSRKLQLHSMDGTISCHLFSVSRHFDNSDAVSEHQQ